MIPNPTTEELHSIPFFKDVPADQLQWMIDRSRHFELDEGEHLSRPGEEITGTHIILAGKLELYRIQNNNKLVVSELGAGTVTGLLPFSRGKTAIAFFQSLEKCRVMTFPKELMKELIQTHYEL